MKSVITFSGIIIINGAVINITDCSCVSFCQQASESLALYF